LQVRVASSAASIGLAIVAALPGRSGADSGEEDSQVLRLPTARVTAVRPAELPEHPTSFATVIEADAHEGEGESVPDLLDDSVGVQVRSFGGAGERSEISIRGSTGQQVVILLDGVRINTAQSGTVDLSTIPIEMVERIEVSRGGGGAAVGSGAIGGVVNIVTRPPGEPRSSLELGAGSFGTWQGSASHADRAGPVDYGVSYSGFTTAGDFDFQSVEVESEGLASAPSRELERVNNRAERHAALVQASGELAPGLRVRAQDQVTFVSRGQPGPDTNPEAPDGGQSRTAHERRTRNVASLRLDAEGFEPLPEDLRVGTSLSYLYEESRFREPEPVAPPFDEPIATRDHNRSGTWRSTAEIPFDFVAEHLASAFLDVRYDSLSSNEQGFHRRTSTALGARDELGFFASRLLLVPSLRFDYSDDFGSEWIPHLGVVVTPLPWLRFKANGQRSYRVPDFDELFHPDEGFIRGNPNLRPERSWNADVGLELGFEKLLLLDEVRLQAAFFYQDIENSIVFQRISPTTVAPTNTEDATVRGVELAGGFELLGWVGFSANWTHQEAELDRPRLPELPGIVAPIRQPSGKALPGQADDEYVLRVEIGPRSGLVKLVGERRYTSKIHLSYSDAPTLSDRTVYDLKAVVDLAQVWRPDSKWVPRKLLASFGVTNVGDESVRDSVGFPQAGRALRFGLEARWW
jgi:iron complex outermembrane receptor protein